MIMEEVLELTGHQLIESIKGYFNYYAKTKRRSVPAMDAAIRTIVTNEVKNGNDTDFDRVRKLYLSALVEKGWVDNITLWPYKNRKSKV